MGSAGVRRAQHAPRHSRSSSPTWQVTAAAVSAQTPEPKPVTSHHNMQCSQHTVLSYTAGSVVQSHMTLSQQPHAVDSVVLFKQIQPCSAASSPVVCADNMQCSQQPHANCCVVQSHAALPAHRRCAPPPAPTRGARCRRWQLSGRGPGQRGTAWPWYRSIWAPPLCLQQYHTTSHQAAHHRQMLDR